MIESFTVTNYVGEKLTITLKDSTPSSGLIVKQIDGIGAPRADVHITDMSTNDGGLYNSARLQTRNIVITFLFTNIPTGENARLNTYKYFPIKKYVTLDFVTENRTVTIGGYVEQNDPDMWAKDSGCQISIVCPDPYFYEANEDGGTSFSGLASLFEFDWSDEMSESGGVWSEENTLIFSEIRTSYDQNIYYSGDADVGMLIEIHAVGPVVNPVIYDILKNQSMKIDTDKLTTLTGSGIVTGDDIIISTVSGNKSITLFRNSIGYNILNTLDRNSDWLYLAQGDNSFAYTADSGAANLMVSFTNKVLYEGI